MALLRLFLVVPVFAMLAVTGPDLPAKFQLEPMLGMHVMRAEEPAGRTAQATLATQLDAVKDAYPTLVGLSGKEVVADDATACSSPREDGHHRRVRDPWRARARLTQTGHHPVRVCGPPPR